MPGDVVRLGIRVDSLSAVKAGDDLDKLGKQAAKTEQKTDKLGKTSKETGKKLKDTGDKAKVAGDKIKTAGNKAKTAGRKMNSGFRTAAKAAGVLAAAVLVVQKAIGAISSARSFDKALAETSTLIEGTTEQMGLLEREAKRLTRAFGGSATDQVKGFYQAISAGADGVKGATVVLEAANKLAIGGITSVTTGVDVLTTALNVYKDAGLTATSASDALFVAMKAGKTTVGELAASMGKVIPLAQTMGVSFDEATAAVAALTKGGISTTESVTGLRAILAAVAKPTDEASKLAAQLGINFSSGGLKAKGFAGFMAELADKTGGNVDQMALLFGGVESLVPALAFAGTTGKSLAKIMEDMKAKAGATEGAYEKMTKSLDFRLSKALGNLGVDMLDQGQIMLSIFVPIVELVAASIGRLKAYFISAGVVLTSYGIYVAAAALATRGLTKALKGVRAIFLRLGGLWTAAFLIIGELLYQFDQLAEKVGGFGKLFGHLKNIAVEVFDRIILAGKKLWKALEIGALGLKIIWLKTFASLVGGFSSFTGVIAKGFNKLFGTDLKGLGEELYEELTTSANAAAEAARTVVKEIEAMDDVTAPLASLAALNKAIEKSAQAAADKIREEKDLIEELAANSKAANEALARLNAGQEAAATAAENLKKKLEGAGKAGEDLADVFDTSVTRAVENVAFAFSDFIAFGEDSFKDFADNILDIFKGLYSDLIAHSVRNKILISLGLEGDGKGTGARGGQRTGVSSGSIGVNDVKGFLTELVNAGVPQNKPAFSGLPQVGGFGPLNTGGLSLNPFAAIPRAPLGGRVIGGLPELGSFSAFQQPDFSIYEAPFASAGGPNLNTKSSAGLPVSNLVAGFAASLLAREGGLVGGLATAGGVALGVAAAIGSIAALSGLAGVAAVAGPVGLALVAIAGLVSFFSKKRKVTDTRLDISFSGEQVQARTATDVTTSQFWGLSKKRSTEFKYIGGSFLNDLYNFNQQSRTAFAAIGETFGAGNALERFTAQIVFSTKGLSQSEIDSRLESELERIKESMARAVVGSAEFVRQGESFEEAAVRMAQAITAVNPVFERLGFELFEVSRAGADAASKLVEFLGGLNNFGKVTDFFFNNFYTASERFRFTSDSLIDTLTELGIETIPASRAAYRSLIEAMQAIGDTEAVGTLYQIAPLFVEMSDNLNIVNAAFEQLNLTLFETSEAGFAAAGDIVGMAGGIRQFTTAAGFYLNNFFSDAEQLEINKKALLDVLEPFGITKLPKTIAGYRLLVEQLDAAGSPDIAFALVKNANLFVEIATAADKAAEAMAAHIRQLETAATRADALAVRTQSAADAAFGRAVRAADAVTRAAARYQEAVSKSAKGFADTLLSVNKTFDKIGLGLIGISREGIKTSQTLVGVFGGLSGFNSATDFFFNKFFTAAEQLKINTDTLSDTFVRLGVAGIPKSNSAFRDLLEQMQAIGDTDAVATLLKIAPLFVEISDAANKAAEANKRFFRTRVDATFAGVTPARAGQPDVQQELLRELLTEMKKGNITIARNTDKTARSVRRMELEQENLGALA